MSALADQPAFPRTHIGTTKEYAAYHNGLSVREHFASLAMQGMMADGLVRDDLDGDKHCYQVFAINAVRMADALIAALEEKP